MGELIKANFGIPRENKKASSGNQLPSAVERLGGAGTKPGMDNGQLDVEGFLDKLNPEIKQSLRDSGNALPRELMNMIKDLPYSMSTLDRQLLVVGSYNREDVKEWLEGAFRDPSKAAKNPAFYRALLIRAKDLGILFI